MRPTLKKVQKKFGSKKIVYRAIFFKGECFYKIGNSRRLFMGGILFYRAKNTELNNMLVKFICLLYGRIRLNKGYNYSKNY